MKLSSRQMLESHIHELNCEIQEIDRRTTPYSNMEKRRKEQDRIALMLSKTRALASLVDLDTSNVPVKQPSQYKLEIRHLTYDKRHLDETKFITADDLPATLEQFGAIATFKIIPLDGDPSRHF